MHVYKPEMIAETENWVAVNKPSGMLSIPDRYLQQSVSVKSWLAQKYPQIFTVHRIDKDTSGIILFAKNEATHAYLSQLFTKRQIRKTYLALVAGRLLQESGTIDDPIGEHFSQKGVMMIHAKGKPAVSHYRLVEQFAKYALVEFEIETGRTHQIRVHARRMGHSIVADPLYGDGKGIFVSEIKPRFNRGTEEERPLLDRLALHASTLQFTGMNGEQVHLEAPFHKDFSAVLYQLRKYNNR